MKLRLRFARQLLIILIPCLVYAPGVEAQNHKAEIERVLRSQQDAWNRHDLKGFMDGYWKSPGLTFFSDGNESHGWQDALEHYRAKYLTAGHEMGKLDFASLRIEVLGSDAAFVRGEYHLQMPDGKTPHGLFTLIFRRFDNGWRIVHDHSCASE